MKDLTTFFISKWYLGQVMEYPMLFTNNHYATWLSNKMYCHYYFYKIWYLMKTTDNNSTIKKLKQSLQNALCSRSKSSQSCMLQEQVPTKSHAPGASPHKVACSRSKSPQNFIIQEQKQIFRFWNVITVARWNQFMLKMIKMVQVNNKGKEISVLFKLRTASM